jgi:pSer/pThr/pTyr-binding forkhead associated (FHA) protein
MTADINLENYEALQHGISRRHALLRPSAKALYLLDLGSTNGTHCNGIPMGQGIAMPLKDRYVLRFGKLNLTVYFLAETTM